MTIIKHLKETFKKHREKVTNIDSQLQVKKIFKNTMNIFIDIRKNCNHETRIRCYNKKERAQRTKTISL